MLGTFILKVKRHETPAWNKIYIFLKTVRSLSLPTYKPIHKPLYFLHVGIKNIIQKIIQGMWIVPTFKARCESCGTGLQLPNGMPEIIGNHLKLYIGNNCTIIDSTLAAGHAHSAAEIIIGDRVTVGYHSDISASLRITIGNDTIIAKDCYIADNDGHPISPRRRRAHEGVNSNEICPVTIGENVWIGTGVCILKGVNIGDNSIIGANSVVVHDIPSNSIAAGLPAKVIKLIGD